MIYYVFPYDARTLPSRTILHIIADCVKEEALFCKDKGATIRRNVVNHLPYDVTSNFILENWVVKL